MKPLHSPIVQGLSNYRDENILRFHMPGHYGRSSFPELKYLAENIFNFDVTEVDKTDNLNDPYEMILESLNEISRIYDSKKSYVLVNGSTSGLYVAIDTLVDNESHVIAARNCHKSVHSILSRKNVNVDYIYPEIDDIFHNDSHIDAKKLIEMVDALLAEGITDISAVILTCPNYFGRTFNLKDISDYLSSKSIFLIIDEAHGAHFTFNEYLPESAISQGATICVQSAHKTLPALTQTCMIHLGHNFPESKMERLEKNINFYQTSSPSYILMASCETSVAIMARYGNNCLNNIKNWIESAKKKLSENPHIKVYASSHCDTAQDFCKLGIKTPIKGDILEKILRQEYKIQCEMSTGFNVLFMIGLTHTEEDIIKLVQSVEDSLKNNKLLFDDGFELDFGSLYPKAKNVKNYILSHTENNSSLLIVTKNISELDNDICAEEIIPYPPGIPLLMPYEKINKDIVKALKYHEFSEIKCFVTV